MPSPKQLANLERGRPYRWKKGTSGNPRGSRGRLARKVPGEDSTYHDAITTAITLGRITEVFLLFRQAYRRRPVRYTLPPESPAPVEEVQGMRPEDWAALARATKGRDNLSRLVDWDRVRRGY